MSFLRAARAALAVTSGVPRILMAVVTVSLAGLFLSCGSSAHRPAGGPNHSAYVTLPGRGSVLLLHVSGATGAITVGAETAQVQNTSPNGIALLPSKKFLYAVNTGANSISIFSVASDGTLMLTGAPTAVSFSPNNAVIDPSGKYLLVTNSLSTVQNQGSVSVFSIDAGTGAIAEVAGSPILANASPSEILITPSGKFVYVTNQSIGMVTAFTFSNGVLTQLPPGLSPVFSGLGASGLAVDGSERFLYVANFSAPNQNTIGNISGFNIDPNTGALTTMPGAPYSANNGSGPTAIAVDPSGRYVYATTPGSSFAIWCFAITPTNGHLVSATNSPFSLTAGSLFALFDPSGNYFYIGSSSGNGLAGYTYNPSTGALTTIAGSPFSTISSPGKMALSE